MNHALLFNVHNLGLRRPPGPYRIATILRDQGWDVEVIEFANDWTLEQLQELARSRITSNTRFVGFGVMFNMWNDPGTMELFSAWLRKTYPNLTQIIGGQWPPVHNSNHIDYYITGYAENAMLELIKVLVGSEPTSSLKFDPKYFGTKKKVISGNSFYPSYPMKSLMIKYEDRDFIRPDEWLTTEFARGCKFKCPYCTYPILGVKYDATRDSEDAYSQLQETYDKYGVTNYFVADETFNDRTEKISKFADVVDRLSFDPWFSGFIRADLMITRGEREWEELARMRFVGHFYGIETMNYETAKFIKKGIKTEKLQQGLIDARKYFLTHGRKAYRGTIAQVLGLPHETKESVANAFRWLEENWQGEAVMVSPLEIPVDETIDVLSALSFNWKDNGYVEDTTEVPVANHYGIAQGHMNSKLNWKNQHMTFGEALKIADEWKLDSETRGLFGIGAFSLDYVTAYGMSVEQALNVRVFPMNKERFDLYLRRVDQDINSYIEKKLSI